MIEPANQEHDSSIVREPPITVYPHMKALRDDPRYKACAR